MPRQQTLEHQFNCQLVCSVILLLPIFIWPCVNLSNTRPRQDYVVAINIVGSEERQLGSSRLQKLKKNTLRYFHILHKPSMKNIFITYSAFCASHLALPLQYRLFCWSSYRFTLAVVGRLCQMYVISSKYQI